MVTNFNIERHLDSPACDAGFPQTFSELFRSLNLVKDQTETDKREERTAIFGKIFERDNSHFLQQCGMYILIDQLITEGERSSDSHQRKNLGNIAKKLLRSCSTCKIMVSPPEKIDTQTYIENIIQQAEVAADENGNHSPFLNTTAKELLNRSNELIEFFSKTWGKNIPYRFVSFQKFFVSWENFAKQFLLERLEELN